MAQDSGVSTLSVGVIGDKSDELESIGGELEKFGVIGPLFGALG